MILVGRYYGTAKKEETISRLEYDRDVAIECCSKQIERIVL